MKRTAILAAAMLLSMLNLLTAQTPDENEFMLWQLDSNLAWTDAIAIHPNGNLFCHNKDFYYEVDFQTGKIIRQLPDFDGGSQVDISLDGRYILSGGNIVVLFDLENETFEKIARGQSPKFHPDSKHIIYDGLNSFVPPRHGHDSSIVILNIETKERKYIASRRKC
jgi:hypothetical protein